jgi:4-hydroxyphenylpyruvate dioxygenase
MIGATNAAPGIDEDVQKLKGIDYIELYVGNAQQSAHFYRSAFGFTPTAYAGLETGVTDRISFLIEQGDIRLVLTSALIPDHPIAEHVRLHGDGVKDIAFAVDDAAGVFAQAVARGARGVAEPATAEVADGRVVTAQIGVYGDTVHSLVQRNTANGSFLPGYRPIQKPPATPVGFSAVDHVAVCVEAGTLDAWSDFYARVFDFVELHQESVSTDYSAMNSRAMGDRAGRIKFPLQEPAPSKRKSQIDDYLSYYQGPGAQHIAVLTGDIVASVRALQANGIEFRATPATYYDMLEARVGPIDADLAALRELSILVDRDQWGYLMQIFCKPMQGRPTMFCELIQREGARGFGSGNIKALFQSVEREQLLRGAL